jgi:hypothetical protein
MFKVFGSEIGLSSEPVSSCFFSEMPDRLCSKWQVLPVFCLVGLVSSCSQPAPPSVQLPSRYDVQVVVIGSRKPAAVPRESFRVSSGQFNVGCGESTSAAVEFHLPPGATDVQTAASWQHTDNLKNQSQNAFVTPDGARATGTIIGLDRQLFNCPGGGHGELILEGSYKPPAPTQDSGTVLKTVHDQVASGQPLLISLPVDPAITLSSCGVIVSNNQQSSSATIKFTTDVQGKLAILQIVHKGSPAIDASLDDNTLTIRIEGQ